MIPNDFAKYLTDFRPTETRSNCDNYHVALDYFFSLQWNYLRVRYLPTLWMLCFCFDSS
uniref:Uncharacterized protein n=1 Tax=Anopheles atroparvus TaxID=41427 RepID=A0AAG5CV68_ANOAO